MLLAKQLLAMTPKKVGDRATYPKVRIYSDKLSGDEDYRAIYTRTSLGNPNSSGDSYTLIIRNHGTKANPNDFLLQADSQLWCHCSCPYFTYYLEVVLKLHKSSEIYNAISKLPRVTNPKLRPYLCKHLYATTIYLMNKDKGLKGNNLYMGIHRFNR